jgi:Fe-S-cluster containining protein
MDMLDKINSGYQVPKDNFYAEHIQDIQKVVEEFQASGHFDKMSDDQFAASIHAEIDAMQKHIDINKHIQCDKQQCSYCCHSEIFISPVEAAYIKNNAVYEIAADRQAKQRTTNYKDLSFADKACIMLKDGKCQIYDQRPTICRNHNVSLGTDPEECYKQNLEQGTHKVEEVRNIALEALSFYLTVDRAKDITDIKNIADYEW